MRVCDPYRWAPAICCGVNCIVEGERLLAAIRRYRCSTAHFLTKPGLAYCGRFGSVATADKDAAELDLQT